MRSAAAAPFINRRSPRHHPQEGDRVKRVSFEEWPLKPQTWLPIKLILRGHETPQAARRTQMPLGLGWRLAPLAGGGEGLGGCSWPGEGGTGRC